MITIRARNFRGCERAEIECAPIALVTGRNKAGKSSIAEGVACALTGNGIPIPGMTKSTLGQLVRTGASGASVEIQGPKGNVSMSWPAASDRTEGEAPTSSAFAAGMSSIVDMTPRDRARALSDYLRATPTREDLGEALEQKGFAPDQVEAIWKLITDHGWDGAHQLRQTRGAELKGQWRQITGNNYGSRVGASYRPDLADLNDRDLSAAIGAAKAKVENAISAAAVSSAEKERLSAEAARLDEFTTALDRSQKEASEAAVVLRAAQEQRQALPPTEAPRSHPCPHCGEPIVVRGSLIELTLEKPASAALNDVQVKARRRAVAEADGKIANANDRLNLARRAIAEAERGVDASRSARERLANWPAAVETGTDIETARAELARAEKRLAEYRAKIAADDVHEKIESNELLLELLAGDGLRASKLAKVLDVFVNQQLRALTEAAGWPERITLDTDMTLYLDGRPYGLLSKSEKYRVRVTLQVAFACLDGSDLIVIDEADILDGPTRGGLFSMLDQAGVPALVCMTLSRREQCPNLAAAELGASYWIEAGSAAPIAPQAAAA